MNTWYMALSEYFPANEMKSEEHFELLLRDKGYFYKIEEGADYVLAYFEQEDFLFIDYVLVHSHSRSAGLGSRIMDQLKKKKKPILLEVEPESIHEPDTIKRVHFYKKIGFQCIDHIQYVRRHPVTKELNEMKLYCWSFAPKSDRWIIEKMAAVYQEVHAYQSKALYGTQPQEINEILILREHTYKQAK